MNGGDCLLLCRQCLMLLSLWHRVPLSLLWCLCKLFITLRLDNKNKRIKREKNWMVNDEEGLKTNKHLVAFSACLAVIHPSSPLNIFIEQITIERSRMWKENRKPKQTESTIPTEVQLSPRPPPLGAPKINTRRQRKKNNNPWEAPDRKCEIHTRTIHLPYIVSIVLKLWIFQNVFTRGLLQNFNSTCYFWLAFCRIYKPIHLLKAHTQHNRHTHTQHI